MENPFTMPIRIKYRPPGNLIIFLSIIHIGALTCLMSLSIPMWLRVLLALIISGSYAIYTYKFLRARHDRVELILSPDNEWRVVDLASDGHDWCRMNLSPGAFVHPRLVVLRLSGDLGKYTFLLSPKNVDRDSLRRLRVRLRYTN